MVSLETKIKYSNDIMVVLGQADGEIRTLTASSQQIGGEVIRAFLNGGDVFEIRFAFYSFEKNKNRNQGYGTALYLKLIKSAFEYGATEIHSDFEISPSVHRIYQKIGEIAVEEYNVIRNPKTRLINSRDGDIYATSRNRLTEENVFVIRKK
jgi:hypothetical protein